MPGLLIHIANGQWVASVANTNIRYNFVGANLDAQADSVQQLALSMEASAEGGAVELAQNIGNAIVLPNGVEGMQVVTDLFGSTDTVILGEQVIYGTVGEEVLIDALDEAGTALVAALGALV
jgi:hypothetical protein